jgi:uncharacterized protein (TIGR02145 family)
MSQIKFFSLVLFLFCVGFSFSQAQTISDSDGNIYSAITIGKQVWMSENLKTTKYNDGQAIPLVTGDNAWSILRTPAYCWLSNDLKNKEIYGALYNWYTVNTKKLCPKGWHIPTDYEWTTLMVVIGDENTAGAKLKETGTAHWKNSIIYSTNEFGFTALPGGMRLYTGNFPDFGNSYAVWWSATGVSETEAWNRGLFFSSNRIFKGKESKKSGFSVRCIRD